MLAGTLKTDLERRGEGARPLQLAAVSGSTARSAASRSAPRGRCANRALIQQLFHERLAALEGDIDAGYGFDLVRLSVLAVAPFDDRADRSSAGER